jgi:hypothetical protein
MRPAKLLVFLVINIASVQRVMRDPAFPDGWRGTTQLPPDVIGYVSRRAIAAATGLPRENVRRIVAELIAEDRLWIGPRGTVANRAGILESQPVIDALQAMLVEHARITQMMIDAGAVTAEAKLDP